MSIGFALAALAVLAARPGGAGLTPLFAPILFLPILFDVAATLQSRALRGRPLTEAHSEHAYQILMRAGFHHTGTTALYFALTLMSAVCAFAAARFEANGQWIVVLVIAMALAPAHVGLHVLGARLGLLALPPARLRLRRRRRTRRPAPPQAEARAVAATAVRFQEGHLHHHHDEGHARPDDPVDRSRQAAE